MANKVYKLRPISATTNTPDAGDGQAQLVPIPINGLVNAGGVAVDASENIYVSDLAQHVIYRWRRGSPQSSIFAGAYGVSGLADGQGATARFNAPTSISCDRSGVIWVVDSGNARVRRIDQNGNVFTVTAIPGPVSPSVIIVADSSDKLYLIDETP
jgi:sugar lactone lactonase YvrE